MGISLFSRCSGSPYAATDPSVSAPDPRKFHVTRFRVVNEAAVLDVVYAGVTNYEGRKILVYRSQEDVAALVHCHDLDPHFSNARPSPVARFEPTDEGWKLAVKFAETL